MANEQSDPDIFVRILNKVEHIDEIDGQLRGIASDLREVKSALHEHGSRFDRIDKTLAKHETRFDRVDLRLNQLDTAVMELHQDFKKHSLHMAN